MEKRFTKTVPSKRIYVLLLSLAFFFGTQGIAFGQRTAVNPPDEEEGTSLQEAISDWEGSGFLQPLGPKPGMLLEDVVDKEQLFVVSEAIPIELKENHLHLGDYRFSFSQVKNGYSANMKAKFDQWVMAFFPELVVVWINEEKKVELFSYQEKVNSEEYLFDAISQQLQLRQVEGDFSTFRNLPLRDALFSILLTIAQSEEGPKQLYLKNGFKTAINPTADDSSFLLATYSPQGRVEDGLSSSWNLPTLLSLGGAGLLGFAFCFIFFSVKNKRRGGGERMVREQGTESDSQKGKKNLQGSKDGKGHYFEKFRNIFLKAETLQEAMDLIEDAYLSEKEVQNAIRKLMQEETPYVQKLMKSGISGGALVQEIANHYGPVSQKDIQFDAFLQDFSKLIQLREAFVTYFPGYNAQGFLEAAKKIRSESIEGGVQDLFQALGLLDGDDRRILNWIGTGTRVDAYRNDLIKIMQAQGETSNGDYLWAVTEGLRMLDQLNDELGISMGYPLEASGHRMVEFLLTGYAIQALNNGGDPNEIIPQLKQSFEDLQPREKSRRLKIDPEFWENDVMKLIRSIGQTRSQIFESSELRQYFVHAKKRFQDVYQLLAEFQNPPSEDNVRTLFQQAIQMAIHYNELITVYAGEGTTAKERMNVDLILKDRTIGDLSSKEYQLFSKLKEGGTNVTFSLFKVAKDLGITHLDDILVQGFYISPEALKRSS